MALTNPHSPSEKTDTEQALLSHLVHHLLQQEGGSIPLERVTLRVSDFESAMEAEQLASGAANVNCPIVFTDEMGS